MAPINNVTVQVKDTEKYFDVLKTINKMDVGNGKNIISTSLDTLSMSDGKNKKGDSIVEDLGDALFLLKSLVANALENAVRRNKKRDIRKWKFDNVPLRDFGKTLDDVFVAFLCWGRIDADETKYDDDEASLKRNKAFNVTKSYRRLEAYASWMEDSGSDLTDLTAASIRESYEFWKMQVSYDIQGRIVWWFDMAALDMKALKKRPGKDCLRLWVWFAHFLMFDENAQENGSILINNIAKVGLWDAMTFVPPDVNAKLDRLTIGVLPVKNKKIILMECSGWLNVILAIIKPFLSKKMRNRIAPLDNDYKELEEQLGGKEYVVKNFGRCDGLFTSDPVRTKYFL